MNGRFLRILLPANHWENTQYSDSRGLPPPNQARVDCGPQTLLLFWSMGYIITFM
jgi:hypothetical protein